MSAADLATLDAVKEWLALPADYSDDALLARLTSAASAFVRAWCGRDFTLQSHHEIRDGTGGTRLFVREAPIVSIEALAIDGRPIAARPAPGQIGFWFSTTALMLEGASFRLGAANVAIDYTAGFAETPADVVQSVIELVGQRYRDRDRIGLASKGLAGETTSFTQTEMPPWAKEALAAYRRVVPPC